jgi:hypothetical protein
MNAKISGSVTFELDEYKLMVTAQKGRKEQGKQKRKAGAGPFGLKAFSFSFHSFVALLDNL